MRGKKWWKNEIKISFCVREGWKLLSFSCDLCERACRQQPLAFDMNSISSLLITDILICNDKIDWTNADERNEEIGIFEWRILARMREHIADYANSNSSTDSVLPALPNEYPQAIWKWNGVKRNETTDFRWQIEIDRFYFLLSSQSIACVCVSMLDSSRLVLWFGELSGSIATNLYWCMCSHFHVSMFKVFHFIYLSRSSIYFANKNDAINFPSALSVASERCAREEKTLTTIFSVSQFRLH